MREIAAENGLTDFGVGYGGSVLIPMIESLIAVGTIRPGDWVVLEDAGDHGADPVGYFTKLRRWRQTVINSLDVTCIMMTMFDYHPFHGELPDAEFDRPYRLPSGRSLSFNDAIRMAANSVYWSGSIPPGKTILVDMNRHMDTWRGRSLREDGVDPMHRDGIHPNCWGQWLMVREIFRSLGILNVQAMNINGVQALAHKNWEFLGYGTRMEWSAARCMHYSRKLLSQ